MNLNGVIGVPADGLAPNGARPSADTVLGMFSYRILLFSWFLIGCRWPNGVILLFNLIFYIGPGYVAESVFEWS